MFIFHSSIWHMHMQLNLNENMHSSDWARFPFKAFQTFTITIQIQIDKGLLKLVTVT